MAVFLISQTPIASAYKINNVKGIVGTDGSLAVDVSYSLDWWESILVKLPYFSLEDAAKKELSRLGIASELISINENQLKAKILGYADVNGNTYDTNPYTSKVTIGSISIVFPDNREYKATNANVLPEIYHNLNTNEGKAYDFNTKDWKSIRLYERNIKQNTILIARGYSDLFSQETWAKKILENRYLDYWKSYFEDYLFDPLSILYELTGTADYAEGYDAAATSIKEFITMLDLSYDTYFTGVLQDYATYHIDQEQPSQGFAKLANMIENGENIDSKLSEIEIELSDLRKTVNSYKPPLPYPSKAKENLLSAISSSENFIKSLKANPSILK